MNYFSHFLVDHQPNQPYYNTALILPDITKRWVKIAKHQTQLTQPNSLHHDLLQGCLQHYISDKLFHGSIFFEKYLQIINSEFKKVSFSDSLNRKWFIAHIALELLIDRVFVRHYPNKLDSFYNDLNIIDNRVLLDFLIGHGLQNEAEFLTFFDHFRSVQYIYYYTDNNRFIYSLSKVMSRVGLKEIGETDADKLLFIILHIESKYMNNPAILLEELKAVFTQ